jgi:hypothetical protein
MSDWNSLETQLRTWKPRQPSPELRERIFAPHAVVRASIPGGTAAPVGEVPIRVGELFRWLVPALGCFLLVAATLSTRNPVHEPPRFNGTNFTLAQANSEEASLIFAQHPDHSDINAVPERHFEWSVGIPVIKPSVTAQIISYTNKLIQ